MNGHTGIYLDNAATTQQDPLVIEAVLKFLESRPGNPSSIHSSGLRAAIAVEKARSALAKQVESSPEKVLFCSGGTEANNFGVRGALSGISGGHIILSAIEHSSVLSQRSALEASGFQVDLAPVDELGIVRMESLSALIRSDTRLISTMHANNEVGTIQPIEQIGGLCKKHKILFHVDAVQSFGKVPIFASSWGIDFLTVSAHKIHGPPGVGAIIGSLDRLNPFFHGGSQENSLRPGTLNAPAIVGLGKASELISFEDTNKISFFRDYLWQRIMKEIPTAHLNGQLANRICNNLNFSIQGKSALLISKILDKLGIYLSTGSACHQNKSKPSHVLEAMYGHGSLRDGLRVTLSKWTTKDELDTFTDKLKFAINQ